MTFKGAQCKIVLYTVERMLVFLTTRCILSVTLKALKHWTLREHTFTPRCKLYCPHPFIYKWDYENASDPNNLRSTPHPSVTLRLVWTSHTTWWFMVSLLALGASHQPTPALQTPDRAGTDSTHKLTPAWPEYQPTTSGLPHDLENLGCAVFGPVKDK